MNRNFSMFVALIVAAVMSTNVYAQSSDNVYTKAIASLLKDKISYIEDNSKLADLDDWDDLTLDLEAMPNSKCWKTYCANNMSFIYPGDYAILLDECYDDVEEVEKLNQSIEWREVQQWLTLNNLNDLKVSIQLVGAKSYDKNAAFLLTYLNAPIVENLSVKGVKNVYNLLFAALYLAAADDDDLCNLRPMHRTNYGGYGGYAMNCDLVVDNKPATAEFFISIQGARVVCAIQIADSKTALTNNTRAVRSIRLK